MPPVDPRAETLRLLTSIDGRMAALLELARTIIQHDAAPPSDDRLCDGPHGDPQIKAKDPRDWSGEPMTGRTFSECPPEYLDLLADRYDYFAGKEPDEKKAGYNRLDARRARAWAARKRNGWTAAETMGVFHDDSPGF